MQVLRLTITHFRGCSHLEITPRGHVLLIGEPGAGRSDVVEALTRVLDPDALRRRPPDVLDFYQRDTTAPIVIELVLGDLGNDLEQHFLEHLDLWDHDQQRVVEELDRPERIDERVHSFVLRLRYRAEWVAEEEQARHWLEYAKTPIAGGGPPNARSARIWSGSGSLCSNGHRASRLRSEAAVRSAPSSNGRTARTSRPP